ncbi:hypothetical protein MNAN1_000585 [Malassezia nana]|uniref:NADH dehydrogenase [ubiquinone] 1 beta subcomplex subunit 11, mitochondrial n=1 Tax=Malassezia nana TaxID=180528 RepID=A0AAF0EP43_9BASI|nr:hypothetical protein MNAN1_000585 [Malassezia nana]
MLGRASSMMPVRAMTRVAARTAPRVQQRYASGHGPSYNEPSGYLFGEKPPAPGTKRVKDAWENIWYWGMYGGVAVFAVVMYFKPDRSVRSWAGPEAEKRLDASGLPWRYKPSPHSGYPNGIP